jgi:phospholipid/cholesterol/gamma-HCH transport system permease protein
VQQSFRNCVTSDRSQNLPSNPSLQLSPAPDGRGVTAQLRGPIVLAGVEQLALQLKQPAGPLTIDLREVTRLDTAGAWLLAVTVQKSGGTFTGTSPAQTALIDVVTRALPDTAPVKHRHLPFQELEKIGRVTVAGARGLISITGFLGLVVARLLNTILHPSRLRFTALVFHMQQAGLNAVPIVALMAFLIGIVLAYQGADQLQQFGAEVFVVDLIAISVLRELGLLLTAIIVAGRSASAFTAAIGSMKMNQEVDAMRTLGLDPIEVLVLPRVLALLLLLPVLGFLADIAGLLGGALMSWYELGISPGMFQTRLLQTDVSHFVVGIAKAPFFAVIIGVIGCYQGMQVEANADSLGRLTSRAVVQAIFMVILADATFSIFFAAVGV